MIRRITRTGRIVVRCTVTESGCYTAPSRTKSGPGGGVVPQTAPSRTKSGPGGGGRSTNST